MHVKSRHHNIPLIERTQFVHNARKIAPLERKTETPMVLFKQSFTRTILFQFYVCAYADLHKTRCCCSIFFYPFDFSTRIQIDVSSIVKSKVKPISALDWTVKHDLARGETLGKCQVKFFIGNNFRETASSSRF